jgi:hypothetical protein
MATKLTKLSAVNIVLSNIGMAPVTTLDNDNPMVSMASNIIDEVSLSLQSEGWVFNTENEYPFIPDPVTGHVTISNSILSLDTTYDQDLNVIIRDGKLYDKRAHTYEFTSQLSLNVVWVFEFEDIPEAFKSYIAMRSANLFAGRAVGSTEQVKFGEREEAMARAAMLQYETEQGDYNMLGTINNRNTVTYRPSFASIRY